MGKFSLCVVAKKGLVFLFLPRKIWRNFDTFPQLRRPPPPQGRRASKIFFESKCPGLKVASNKKAFLKDQLMALHFLTPKKTFKLRIITGEMSHRKSFGQRINGLGCKTVQRTKKNSCFVTLNGTLLSLVKAVGDFQIFLRTKNL